MKKIIIVLIFSLHASCSFYNGKVMFDIKNDSNSVVDSLKIEPNNSDYISLKPGERKKYFVNMKKAPKVDGAYVLHYKINNEGKSIAFGYFSNGFPSGESFEVLIEENTVRTNYKLD